MDSSNYDVKSKTMKLTYLGFAWVILLAGVVHWFFPLLAIQHNSQLVVGSEAITDIRAMYGGVQVGLGWYLLTVYRSPNGMRDGFKLLAVVVAIVGLTRGVGAFIDGGEQTMNVLAGCTELIAGAIAFYLSRKC